jgi:beta-xylosidase
LIDDTEGNWWFFYTGYENGYSHYGRQSLLLPVEWTTDGWPRIRPGVAPTDNLHKPAGENVGHGMPLSDDFTGSELGIQWSYDPGVKPSEAFRLGGGQLTMKAGEKNALAATWLGVTPVNHAYEAEAEVTVPAGAEGGLLLSGKHRRFDGFSVERERSHELQKTQQQFPASSVAFHQRRLGS